MFLESSPNDALQVHIGRSFTAAAETGYEVRRAVAAALHPQYVQSTSANDVSGQCCPLPAAPPLGACPAVGASPASSAVVGEVQA